MTSYYVIVNLFPPPVERGKSQKSASLIPNLPPRSHAQFIILSNCAFAFPLLFSAVVFANCTLTGHDRFFSSFRVHACESDVHKTDVGDWLISRSLGCLYLDGLFNLITAN